MSSRGVISWFFYFLDLQNAEFIERQKVFANMITESLPRDILDIRPFLNPIILYLDISVICPANLVVVEPVLGAVYVVVCLFN